MAGQVADPHRLLPPLLQGISELIKRIAVMRGLIPDPYVSAGGVHSAAEAEAERILAVAKTDAQ